MAAITFSGLNIVGGMKCAQLVLLLHLFSNSSLFQVARQFIPYVMAVVSMIMNIITLICPAMVAIFCPDETNEQWARLFFWLAIVLVIFSAPFLFLAESKPAEWTKPGWKRRVTPV